MRNLNKKNFLFCCPHTLTIGLEAPVYRGFSGEGKCESVRAEMAEATKKHHQTSDGDKVRRCFCMVL